MSGIGKVADSGRRCASCGTELGFGPASGLCTKCLLEAGFRTEPCAGETGVVSASGPAAKGLPEPGERFGHYHLIRPLGQGGMGVVFEAEDLESGRRVALKVLSQALDSPEARKRFLREGQLAASINHTNSVYVFGTEEVAGTPVIAMELLPGGTLQERVAASGALPVVEAVDCVLQIMAGLEAAQQIGILHRDIKPSNCFVDTNGTVKIGDFGLSIGTGVRTEPDRTATGTLFGTPAFSSPEQLRGEELTVRSDIYALGVTLYYLLTGRKPFEAANVVQMLATVLERRAESPARWQAGIPGGLCRVVLRCLEKDPRERFGSYAKLREALLPYTAAATTPATPGRRFLAGGIDMTLLGPVFVAAAAIHGWSGTALTYGLMLLYFGGLEGIWGASLGKLILRLRVVCAGANRPDLRRAFLRALAFLGLSMLTGDLLSAFVLGIDDSSDFVPAQAAMAVGVFLLEIGLLAMLFVTARRRNGYAAIHDRLSGTRVIFKTIPLARPQLASPVEALPNLEKATRFGPYHLLQRSGGDESGETLLAFDTRLLRKVWIRTLKAGTPAVGPELRNLARPTRLRWLTGKRSPTEAWDAYQAVEGQPLLNVIEEKQSWGSIRFWLLDLARELEAARRDGMGAVGLSLDRLWLGTDGRVVLLDFPAPGVSTRRGDEVRRPRAEGRKKCEVRGSKSEGNSKSEVRSSKFEGLIGAGTGFEGEAEHTVGGGTGPTPQEFLRQLAFSGLHGRVSSVQEARAASLEVPLALHGRAFVEALGAEGSLAELVRQLEPMMNRRTVVSWARRLALLVAGLWWPLFLMGMVVLMEREALEDISSILALTWIYGLVVVIVPGWLAALFFRGGALLRGLGIAVVRRDGRTASRGRVFWRYVVAYLPFVILPGVATSAGLEGAGIPTGPLLLGLLAGMTLISLLLPRRSLQDRLAGTDLVPR